MFSILPYKKIILHSPLSREATLRQLSENIKPPFTGNPFTRFMQADGLFHGEVKGDTFAMRRAIRYRNSYLPFIKGTVTHTAQGSSIEVVMKMHGFIRLFMALWLGLVAIACLALSYAFIRHGVLRHDFSLFIPFGMLLFGWGLMAGCFYPEADIAKKFLATTLQARTT